MYGSANRIELSRVRWAAAATEADTEQGLVSRERSRETIQCWTVLKLEIRQEVEQLHRSKRELVVE